MSLFFLFYKLAFFTVCKLWLQIPSDLYCTGSATRDRQMSLADPNSEFPLHKPYNHRHTALWRVGIISGSEKGTSVSSLSGWYPCSTCLDQTHHCTFLQTKSQMSGFQTWLPIRITWEVINKHGCPYSFPH